jgi:hypothetical protein
MTIRRFANSKIDDYIVLGARGNSLMAVTSNPTSPKGTHDRKVEFIGQKMHPLPTR